MGSSYKSERSDTKSNITLATSPPSKADSYHSGMSMPSSDSQASLDLETNTGYDFFAYLY